MQVSHEECEGVIDLTPGDGLGAATVTQGVDLFHHDVESVTDPLQTHCRIEVVPIGACVGERDEMSCKIAAIDGRDILWIERTKIARAVPVVEMSSKAGKTSHR